MSDVNNQSRLIPINKWNDYHPWPSAGGLRWLRFRSKEMGMDGAFKTVGRRVLIDESEFFRIIREQKLKKKESLHV